MDKPLGFALGAVAGLVVGAVFVGLVAGLRGLSPEGDVAPNVGSALFGAVALAPYWSPAFFLAGGLVGWILAGRRRSTNWPPNTAALYEELKEDDRRLPESMEHGIQETWPKVGLRREDNDGYRGHGN